MTENTTAPVGEGYASALASERAARKQAEREVKELRAKYRAKCDEAELWAFRSNRNRELLRTVRANHAAKEATQNEH